MQLLTFFFSLLTFASLTHRIPHPLSPDQMHMQMENALPAVGAGVRDHTEPAISNSLLVGEFAGDGINVPDDLFVLRFESTDRFNVLVRHDQNVRRCHGMDVAKCGDLLIAIDNRRFGFIRNDPAKDTTVRHLIHHP